MVYIFSDSRKISDIHTLLSLLQNRKMNVKHSDWLEIDYKFVFNILGFMISYTIFIVQVSSENKN